MTASTMDKGPQTTNLRRLHPYPARRDAPRLAFTLVEMLVVITIIGILASLATVAAYKALEAAKRARITAEIANLDGAMKAYKEKYGDYPPSYLDQTDSNALTAMKRHLAKAFPRCNPNNEVWFIPWYAKSNGTPYYPYPNAGGTMQGLWDPRTSNTYPTTDGTPMGSQEAMLFWLTAASKDSIHPLSAATTDRQSFFDFDKSRITRKLSGSLDWDIVTPSGPPGTITLAGTQCPIYNVGSYIPAGGNAAPYVYLEARQYLLHAIRDTSQPALNGCPYLSEPWDTNGIAGLDASTAGTPDVPLGTTPAPLNTANALIGSSFTAFQNLCANPKTFQIISAGLDGNYGTANTATAPPPAQPVKYDGSGTAIGVNIYWKSYPTGIGYDSSGADDDNLTNFSDKQLGDAKP